MGGYTTVTYSSYVATWTSGDCTCTLDVVTGIFTVSGNGAMYDYVDAPDVPWVQFRPYIIKVVVDSGVTSVG